MSTLQSTLQPKTKIHTNGQAKNGQLKNGQRKGVNGFGMVPAPKVLPDYVTTKTVLDGVRSKVFLDRYSLKDEEGVPTEEYPEQMWYRVAWGIAQEEKTSKLRREWTEKFYKAMEDFKFVPGGRILSGAGTGYQVTFFNCYVIPSPKDSRRGIMENITHTVEIQARGGGVGVNLSSLRPHGSRVKKVNGTSSGPVNWASLYSTANHDVIQQGGSRRGALMLMLHDWHPDVLEFIHVKEDTTKIPGANLSVCVSDKFMDAVAKDGAWETKFPDTSDPDYDELWDGDIEKWENFGKKVKVYETLKAQDIWDQICHAAWRSAEPGLHFLERSNKQSNTWYFEKLLSTNPCVTADTWVHTNQGPRQVKDLIGLPFIARVNGQDYISGEQGFFKTGEKQIIEIKTKEGYSLQLTQEHLIKKIINQTRLQQKSDWIKAKDLQHGDKIVLNNHQYNIFWSGKYSFHEGFLLGLLIGDGTLKKDKAILSVWDQISVVGGIVTQPHGPQAVMDQALASALTLPHRSDFKGWIPVVGRQEKRLSLAYVRKLAIELGLEPGNKVVTSEIEKTSSNFYQGFLRGLFDADGSVQGSQSKGVSIRLAQSDLEQLRAIQRLLLRLGIVTTIYQNRRKSGKKFLPNGKGSQSEYQTKAQHELAISGVNLTKFDERIGFSDNDKAAKLKNLLTLYKRNLNKERFSATVESISNMDKQLVYDVSIPSINAFDANGLYVHNCGEQPLGEWAVCNLGAMNLAAFVKDGEFDFENLDQTVRVAMRFMDNVVDANYYFYDVNEKKAKEIRRTGIGTMGIADALIKMKLKYGSEEATPVIEKIYQTIRDAAYEVSSDLAKEKGSFPKFDKEKYLQGHFIKTLSEGVRDKIAKQGIRNAVILTQAPTGTTSLLSGVSSGIEPVFDFKMIRRDRIGEHIIYHPLFKEWLDASPNEDKPDYFVSSNELTPEEHIKVQALIQRYTDSSISKTANAPSNHTVDEVKRLYIQAYELGCKGVTYFRDGSRSGVLYHEDSAKDEKQEEKPLTNGEAFLHRPMILRGRTYKMQTPVGEAFVTINRDESDHPFEVFVNIGKGGMHTMADAEAMGRLVSLCLRIANKTPHPRVVAEKIVAQLRGIGASNHVGFGKDRVMSLADAIAKVLAEDLAHVPTEAEAEPVPLHLTLELPNGLSNGELTNGELKNAEATPTSDIRHLTSDLCPECGNATFAYEEGCKKCYSCGYSMC